MKKILTLLFLLPFFVFAQNQKISGVVYDAATKKPMPFVNITVNNSKMGSAADIDGVFSFTSARAVNSLKFSFIGYQTLEMKIDGNTKMPLKVFLHEDKNELEAIDVVAGENPAHKIIRKAVANRKKNNPEALPTFSYTSYNKFVITFKIDSSAMAIDTNWVNENTDSATFRVDSSGYEAKHFFDKQHLFILESVSQRKYSSSPKRNNEKVIASRVSGFKNPTFTLLATQMQSFSFYNDFITLLEKDYVNPISKGSTNRYIFIIQDTTISGTDSTFIISFRPVFNHKFDALEGVLYITSDGWALKNIVASPFDQTGFGITIQSKSEKFGEGWFPVQMNYDFKFIPEEGDDMDGFEPLGIGRTYISKIDLDEEYKRKDFSRIEVKITDNASKENIDIWEEYRINPLDSKELETYRVIDSLGEAENFETKLTWLQALMTGKFRYSFVDFDLNRVMSYNIYEGLRLGVGAHTNYKMLEWLSVGGYVAYGFKDKTFKYNYEADLILNSTHGLILNGGYLFDIEQTGAQRFNMKSRGSTFLQSDYSKINQQQFDEVSKVYFNLSWDVFPNLHSRVFFNRQNRFVTEIDYRFQESSPEGEILINGFNIVETGISLQYAPKDKYMEGPFGRKPIDKSYPLYQIQYTRGLNNVLDGDYSYDKIDVRIQYQFKTKRFGVSKFDIAGGYVTGNQPYPILYTPKGNRPVNVNWSIYPAGKFAFETMYNNEFISDAWVHLMFRQNFKGHLFKIGNWNPHVEILFSAIFGTLDNPEPHKNVAFKTLEQGFYETGIELNKMWNGLGLGFYYRLGPYQLPTFDENYSLKFTYRLDLF